MILVPSQGILTEVFVDLAIRYARGTFPPKWRVVLNATIEYIRATPEVWIRSHLIWLPQLENSIDVMRHHGRTIFNTPVRTGNRDRVCSSPIAMFLIRPHVSASGGRENTSTMSTYDLGMM